MTLDMTQTDDIPALMADIGAARQSCRRDVGLCQCRSKADRAGKSR